MSSRLEELLNVYNLPDALKALDSLLQTLRSTPAPPVASSTLPLAEDVHIADSLVGCVRDEVRSAGSIADIGSGAGFPGLVIAAVWPDTTVYLLESVGKKCEYIEQAAKVAGLKNVEVVCARVEEWAPPEGAVDLVTARALASLPILLEYAAPLLKVGGGLLAWKGSQVEGELRAGLAAAKELGMSAPSWSSVTPYPEAKNRHLCSSQKLKTTPASYPRRVGMAKKRPLGTT